MPAASASISRRIWSQPPAPEDPATGMEVGSAFSASSRSSMLSYSESAGTVMTPTSVPSMPTQRITSTPPGYLPCAIWVTPTVEVATRSSPSDARLPATLAKATAPTPPGMLVT